MTILNIEPKRITRCGCNAFCIFRLNAFPFSLQLFSLEQNFHVLVSHHQEWKRFRNLKKIWNFYQFFFRGKNFPASVSVLFSRRSKFFHRKFRIQKKILILTKKLKPIHNFKKFRDNKLKFRTKNSIFMFESMELRRN